ncbi:putative NRPS-like enzyme [Neohortaea acidophila]|uniref:Putative NRPS-like enzyme n=1 Tax=Neohortaea acidophila TaxID=245834 RepID=A0A6A6PP69_9PEZI|nr:putative NRPS-like enzyme [Neohortaea acidophila]KAF2481900.1 putative NRPS-like enzyme [Neohortaea acidophila]
MIDAFPPVMAPSTRASTKRSRPATPTDNKDPSRDKAHKTNGEHADPPQPLHTIYDLITTRANEPGLSHNPLIFYPSSGTEYVGYSAADIHKLSLKAATYYDATIPQRQSSDVAPTVVALLGPSDLDYFVAILGLIRLGHTVLFLSTRISEEAHVSLLERTKAKHLWVSDGFRSMAKQLDKRLPHLGVHSIASQDDYGSVDESVLPASQLDPAQEAKNVAWIIHSSGSTSLPKPNFQTHRGALGNTPSQFHLTGFLTLPIYHAQGIGCVFRSINNRKPIYMYNASLPLTTKHILQTLQEHPEIQILYSVPYVAKLLADSEEGIALCKKLQVLFCGGGACPKPVGDKLVKNGVFLMSHVGASETGQLMNSFRPRDEIEEWDWLRPSATLQKYLRWEAVDDVANNVYEMVVLDGWPSLSARNREDGAYATKDLWERHPDYPRKNAWRYYARRDDTIVLSNGEKANPLIFENAARDSPKVDDAIVYGSEKPHLGMFVLPSDEGISRDEIVEDIWPDIERANLLAPAHAQLSKAMISCLAGETSQKIRRTDKSSIIRAGFYKEFASLIDTMYHDPIRNGTVAFNEAELKSFLLREVKELVEADRQDAAQEDTDLFSLGMDSLQASRVRSTILKHVDIGNGVLGENFVFDFPSIDAMAIELLRLRNNEKTVDAVPVEQRMERMVEKYSANFPRHVPGSGGTGEHVLVTGATGSLGAHIIAQLASRPEVQSTICLVRAKSDDEALRRVQDFLRERGIEVDGLSLHGIAADFALPHFGLEEQKYARLREQVTCVIHSAWNVNFNLSLESFEQDCIAGTRQLIDLCLESKRERPAAFIFCSSISTVGNAPHAEMEEQLAASFSFAQKLGYAQSKLVTEKIASAASSRAGLPTRILRIGQIVGDNKAGIWNRQEAIPLMIQSASTIGALPKLDEDCSWLPVDIVATAVIDSWLNTCQKESQLFDFYNVINCNTFHWTRDLLPMLQAAGLTFEAVSASEWLAKLRSKPDLSSNPPYKLIEFFTAKYGNEHGRRSLTFRTDKAIETSSALKSYSTPTQSEVDSYVRHIMHGL